MQISREIAGVIELRADPVTTTVADVSFVTHLLKKKEQLTSSINLKSAVRSLRHENQRGNKKKLIISQIDSLQTTSQRLVQCCVARQNALRQVSIVKDINCISRTTRSHACNF